MKNAIVKAAFELKSSHVCERRSKVRGGGGAFFFSEKCGVSKLNPPK